MISIRQIIKELTAEKTRLILTILAVAWGTFAIATMLAVGEGLRLTFGRAMSSVGQGLVYMKGGQTSTIYSGQAINQRILLTPQDVSLLKAAIPGIKSLSPDYNFSATLQYQQKTFPAEIHAVNPNYAHMRNIIPQTGGRFIDRIDMTQHRRVIVIGNDVADTLFSESVNPVGKTIAIAHQPFLVIGVMKKKFQMVGFPDGYLAWIPSSTYVTLANPKKIDQIVFVPKVLNQGELIKNQVSKLIAFKRQLDPNDQNIIKYRDFQDIQDKSAAIFTGMEIFLGVVGCLTLIVAGVGIANVMFISVNSATREIGIRMAVGARSYQVLIHYVVEALLATAVGGIIGILITKGVIALIAMIPMRGQFFQMIGKPKPVLSTGIMVIVMIILGIIGLMSGIFPARKAAKIDPAVALRYG